MGNKTKSKPKKESNNNSKNNTEACDITTNSKSWFYSDVVKENFFKPKNIFKNEAEIKKYQADGIGIVGSPACGDVMKMWIQVDAKTDKIKDCKWQCFGCGSAIATTSVLSEMVTENGGMKLDEALKIRPMDIVKKLGGLPAKKIHCSVLGDQSLRAAIYDYFKKSKQENRLPKKDPLMEEEH